MHCPSYGDNLHLVDQGSGLMKMTTEILRRIGFSEEMQACLKEENLSEDDIIDMVCGSPVPLEEKLDILQQMPIEKTEICETIRRAIDELQVHDGEVFLLFKASCVPEIAERDESESISFSSNESVQRYISQLSEDGNQEKDSLRWYVLEKYAKDGEGNYQNIMIYWMINDEVFFCSDNTEGTEAISWMDLLTLIFRFRFSQAILLPLTVDLLCR